MAIVINGSGTVTGISVGGLPDGIVDAGTLATNSVDSAELIDGSIDTAHIAADQITGAILPAGSVIQVVGFTNSGSGYFATSSETYVATLLTMAITPSATSSKIMVLASSYASTEAVSRNMQYAIHRDIGGAGFSTLSRDAQGHGVVLSSTGGALLRVPLAVSLLDSPNTTSAVTYTMYIKAGGAYAVEMPPGGGSHYITLMEIAG